MANITKLLNVSKALGEIVGNQTQVRTNKLKPILEEITGIINDPSEGSAPEVENKEIEKLASFILDQYPEEPGKAGESESAVEVAIRLLDPEGEYQKENRYLKRRLTMYDLKISKLEKEIKDLKK